MGGSGSKEENEVTEAPPPGATAHITRYREENMSSFGLDLGTAFHRAAVHVARDPGGLPRIVRHEASGAYEGKATVAFRDGERLFGDAADSVAMRSAASHIAGVKRLLGLSPSDLDELRRFHPRNSFRSTPTQKLLLHVPGYAVPGLDPHQGARDLAVSQKSSGASDSEGSDFLPEQIAAMLVKREVERCRKNLGHEARAVAIAVPASLDRRSRRAVLDAAQIAGVQAPMCVDEGTCVAACYAFRHELPVPPNAPKPMLFVDIGEAHTRLTLVTMTTEQLTVVGRAWDDALGTRDFDAVVFDLARKCIEDKWGKGGPKIESSARASARLAREATRIKNMLSANPVAQLNIEALLEDRDASIKIERAEFEERCAPLLEKLRGCITELGLEEKARQYNVHMIHVEATGGGTRIPCVRRTLAEMTGTEDVSSTLDASTSVALGAALVGAILTGSLPYVINDTIFEVAAMGITPDDLRRLRNNELAMMANDANIRATRDAKNELESYIYDTKGKLSSARGKGGQSEEIQLVLARLEDEEGWLYDDGENAELSVYCCKLAELREMVDQATSKGGAPKGRGNNKKKGGRFEDKLVSPDDMD